MLLLLLGLFVMFMVIVFGIPPIVVHQVLNHDKFNWREFAVPGKSYYIWLDEHDPDWWKRS